MIKGEKDIDSKKNTTYNLLTLAEKFMGIEYYAYIIKSEKKVINNNDVYFFDSNEFIKNVLKIIRN